MTLLFFALACAPSIDPGGEESGGGSDVQSGEAVVDATSETDWVYLDLAGARIVSPATPSDSTEWDLALRRYKAAINGGISGTADMAVVPYFKTPYDTVLEAPTGGWVTDVADADADGDPEYALDTWFAYDTDTHEVTPADVIFVVRDRSGELVKLQFLAYYDEAGSPGYVHLQWGGLDDQSGTGEDGGSEEIPFTCSSDSSTLTNTDLGGGVTQTQVYTGSVKEWMCWSFAASGLVGGDGSNAGWDLSMQKWDFRTGVSQVAVLPKQDFDALTQAPAKGWLTDTDDKLVFGDWYVYDTKAHTLNPADLVFVVQTAEGRYFKMKFLTYYPPSGDTKQPHWPAWKWAEVLAP